MGKMTGLQFDDGGGKPVLGVIYGNTLTLELESSVRHGKLIEHGILWSNGELWTRDSNSISQEAPQRMLVSQDKPKKHAKRTIAEESRTYDT